MQKLSSPIGAQETLRLPEADDSVHSRQHRGPLGYRPPALHHQAASPSAVVTGGRGGGHRSIVHTAPLAAPLTVKRMSKATAAAPSLGGLYCRASCTDFLASDTDFLASGTDFLASGTDFLASGTDFLASDTD
ncbi:hypothetical protein ACOMHN_023496 [Nucella lapillus]